MKGPDDNDPEEPKIRLTFIPPSERNISLALARVGAKAILEELEAGALDSLSAESKKALCAAATRVTGAYEFLLQPTGDVATDQARERAVIEALKQFASALDDAGLSERATDPEELAAWHENSLKRRQAGSTGRKR